LLIFHTAAAPALSATPADGLSLMDLRARLADAAAATDASPLKDALIAILQQPSPVDAVCHAFQALAAEASLTPTLKARAIECAEAIAAGAFHNLGGEAQDYAATGRAQLAALTD